MPAGITVRRSLAGRQTPFSADPIANPPPHSKLEASLRPVFGSRGVTSPACGRGKPHAWLSFSLFNSSRSELDDAAPNWLVTVLQIGRELRRAPTCRANRPAP